tara:strand:- start:318 stop:518 length:201 start_codon:yes stop_codon:yes gene_type:complete
MTIRTVTKIPFNDNDLFVVYNDVAGNAIADVTTCVPIDTNNTDYQEVLEWVADGGKISDAPVLKTD